MIKMEGICEEKWILNFLAKNGGVWEDLELIKSISWENNFFLQNYPCHNPSSLTLLYES